MSRRRAVVLGSVLLVALCAVATWLDVRVVERELSRMNLDVLTEEAATSDFAEQARAIRYSPEVHIDRPSRIQITLERTAAVGVLMLGCALVEDRTSAAQELAVTSRYIPSVGEPKPSRLLRETITFDGVAPGKYLIRFEPRWEAWSDAPAPKVRVTARVVRGSTLPFFAAALLIVAPLYWLTGKPKS